MTRWAQDFYEIQDAVKENGELQNRIIELVDNEPIPGKVTEGNDRTQSLRTILSRFFENQIGLNEAFQEVLSDLPRQQSPHSNNNRVFPDGWEERLVRTQVSRFYNQAVLSILKERGDQRCYIPHSSEEDPDSPCTLRLAGSEADIDILLKRLKLAYREGEWHDEVKIPNHPHCTHTIVPPRASD